MEESAMERRCGGERHEEEGRAVAHPFWNGGGRAVLTLSFSRSRGRLSILIARAPKESRSEDSSGANWSLMMSAKPGAVRVRNSMA